jgi:membrane-associated phospholipid phosphatase
MTAIETGRTVSSCLLLILLLNTTSCYAQAQEQGTVISTSEKKQEAKRNPRSTDKSRVEIMNVREDSVEGQNALGLTFARNLLSDQKAIWTAPSRLHWADGAWLFPLAGVTTGAFLTDRSAAHSLSNDPAALRHYRNFSDYGLAAFVGVGAGAYLFGRVSHNDHASETGVLAGEAALDSLAVNTLLKFSFGRDRPFQGQGQGLFFQHGSSFPSDHAAVAWSIASVFAHEYPGPLTQILSYGMATAVSLSRVRGKEHFPSDVIVGSAMGWLIGREVYRRHHDSRMGGLAVRSLSGNFHPEERRDRRNMGSPFVPLDSWVYPAFERLAALRYTNTQVMGLKPWTRIECARVTEEAGESLQRDEGASQDLIALQRRLHAEFGHELSLLEGGGNLTANLESLYIRGVSVSGPALTDSYHFGQTIAYDFGRPYERGMNGQIGGSFSAVAGPLVVHVRAEFQHAPAAPRPPASVVNTIALSDAVSISHVPSGPVAAINRPRLLDAYAGVNLGNLELIVGKQSLSWTSGPGGSLLWSNNAEPVDMVRLVNPEPFRLPGFLRIVGPVKIDQFFGRLGGHLYVPRPFIFGQKLNFKPFPFLEIGISRTVSIGGKGGDPLTAGNFVRSFTGFGAAPNRSVPGDAHTGMDWVFYVPGVRNYIVLYGDSYADDDILPIENPARNPWHPGIYITRIPGIPKLDFHLEGVSTEAPGGSNGLNQGRFNYWNNTYPDGYTNNGNLIGNAVGRDGRTIQCWLTYWLSPNATLQFIYKNNSVSADFIPGGGAWQDYGVRNETYLPNGFYLKSQFQYEHISHYPVLLNGPRSNFSATVEIGFYPERKK